jgi:hypothetical protein
VSAYFSRHVSGVGTLESGVDRVDGVHLSMSTDEKGTTRSPAGPSKLGSARSGLCSPLST